MLQYFHLCQSTHLGVSCTQRANRERSGSVVECLTRGQGAAGSSLTCVTAVCPKARHIYPSLELVQPLHN